MHAAPHPHAAYSGKTALRRYAPWIIFIIVLLHALVLYGLMQLKVVNIQQQKRAPVQVRIVTIQPEQPRVMPTPAPSKPEPEPQKKPQAVIAPQPKVIAAQKPLTQPSTVTPKTVTPKPVPTPVTAPPTPSANLNKEPPAPVAPPNVAPVVPVAEPVSQEPKRVQIGGDGAQWSRSPQLSYSNRDLDGQNRSVTVLIEADETGKITTATITKSSGLSALDNKVLRAVRYAKFKPYKLNGQAIKIRAEQPFGLNLNDNP